MSSTTESKRAADVAKMQADQAASDALRAEQEAKIAEADLRFRSGPIHYQINLTENLGIGDQVRASQSRTQALTENLAVQAQTKGAPAATATTYQGIKSESASVQKEIVKSQQTIAELQKQKEARKAYLESQITRLQQPGAQSNYSQMLEFESYSRELHGLDSEYGRQIQQQERNLSALQTVSQKLSKAKQTATVNLISQTPTYANPEYAKKGSPEYLGTAPKEYNAPKWTETQKKIQEGDTTRLYGKSGYIPYEEQHPLLQDAEKSKVTTQYTLSLTEGGPPGPKNYAVSLSEGKPPTPKNYTQEQVNKLSPQEYAVYQAEYAAYNQYVKQKNAEIKKENRLSLKGYQSNVLGIITQAKKEGATGLQITNEQGKIIETTPLDRAFYDISKLRGQNIFVTPVGQAKTQVQKTQTPQQQTDYLDNIKNELGLNTPIISAMEQKRMTVDEAVNAFVAPAKSLGMQVAALPEGFYREATQGQGAGAKWYKKEVEPKLPPTFFGSAVSGQPSGKSSAYQKTTILGEVALAAIPTLGAKLLERIRGIRGEPPARTTPEIAQTRQVTRTKVEAIKIKESVRMDTATPFQQERISLGRGIGKTPEGYKPTYDKGVQRKPAIEADINYKPELPKTRAKEIGTYKIQQNKVFAADIVQPKFVETRIGLGTGTTKRITPSFETKRIELGEAKIVLKKETVSLGRGVGSSPSIEDQINPKSISEDPYYQPNLPKTRAKKIGTYRIQQEKVFVSDKKIAGFEEQRISLGRGIGKTISGEGAEALQGKRPPPKPEEPSGKGSQRLIMEKPAKVGGFKTTKIELGKGEVSVIAAGGGAAVAPLPLLAKGEDQGTPLVNTTQQNGTSVIVEPDLTQTISSLEPQSITQSRPSLVGAITAGTGVGLYQQVNPKVKTQLGLGTRAETTQKEKRKQPVILSYAEVTGLRQPQKERQRTATPFPEPTRQPQRLAQPEAFKEREKLKLKVPEKIPKKIPQRFEVPFAEKKKERIQREKKEEKDRVEFIGNVLEEQIPGGFAKFDIKYGKKAVGKQSRIGLSISRKERKPFVTTKSESFLAERGHYFTEKKQKPISRSGFAKPRKFRL